MSTQIRQVWGDAQDSSLNPFTSHDFFQFVGVEAGNTLVALVFAEVYDANVISFIDNYGNTWEQVPGARVTVDDGLGDAFGTEADHTGPPTGRTLDIWIARNAVATLPTDFTTWLHTTYTLDKTPLHTGVVVYEIVGSVDVKAVGVVNSATPGTSFAGPSLSAGSVSAAYIAGFFNYSQGNGFPGHTPVSSPWTEDTVDGGAFARIDGAYYSCVASGTQQPVFTLRAGASPAIVSAIALSNETQPDSGGGGSTSTDVPFLGSVVESSDVPAGASNPFIGSFTVVSSAPSGVPVPFLGKFKSGSPAPGQSNPSLGKVVIVGSVPAGANAPFLGTAEKA
jgi:hypothetical protein